MRREEITKVRTTLEPGAAVKTRVVDAATGAPLFLICVSDVDANYAGPTWDYTGTDGRFQLPGFRTQGLWVEYSDAEDCWYGDTTAAATPVEVTVGQPTSVTIETSANGAPRPGPTAARRPAVKRGPTTLLGAPPVR